MPAVADDKVTEGGKPLGDSPQVEVQGMQGDRLVLEIGSGSYTFRSKVPIAARSSTKKVSRQTGPENRSKIDASQSVSEDCLENAMLIMHIKVAIQKAGRRRSRKDAGL